MLQPGSNIELDEDGNPTNKYRPAVTDDFIKSRLRKAMDNPYKPIKDEYGNVKEEEREHEGKTTFEVAMDKLAQRAGEGDYQATKEILDRTIGKPKQTIEQTGNIQLTIHDWIDQRLAANPQFMLELQTPTRTKIEDVSEVVDVMELDRLKGF